MWEVSENGGMILSGLKKRNCRMMLHCVDFSESLESWLFYFVLRKLVLKKSRMKACFTRISRKGYGRIESALEIGAIRFLRITDGLREFVKIKLTFSLSMTSIIFTLVTVVK